MTDDPKAPKAAAPKGKASTDDAPPADAAAPGEASDSAAVTSVTAPLTRTCRRSPFQWKSTAAFGWARSWLPLALSKFV